MTCLRFNEILLAERYTECFMLDNVSFNLSHISHVINIGQVINHVTEFLSRVIE